MGASVNTSVDELKSFVGIKLITGVGGTWVNEWLSGRRHTLSQGSRCGANKKVEMSLKVHLL